MARLIHPEIVAFLMDPTELTSSAGSPPTILFPSLNFSPQVHSVDGA